MKLCALTPRRAGVTLALALASAAATGLPAREAHAYAWYCDVMDGPNAPLVNNGYNLNGFAQASYGSAVVWGGSMWAFYTMTEGSTSGYVKYGANYLFGSSTPWELANLDGPGLTTNLPVQFPNAIVFNNQIWTSYLDSYGGLYVGGPGSLGPGPGTKITLSSANGWCPQALGQPTMVVDAVNGKLFVFYATNIYSSGSCMSGAREEIHFSVTNGTSWLVTDQVLVGGTNSEVGSPAAINFGSTSTSTGLSVVYVDSRAGALKETFSTNSGSTWSTITLDPNLDQYGNGGLPSLLVDSSQALHVFYSRPTSSWVQLMDGIQTSPGATPTLLAVDGQSNGNGAINGYMSRNSKAAATPWGGAQVYYSDDHAHTIRGAYYSGGQWYPTLLDGGASGNLCSGTPGGSGVQEPSPAPTGFLSRPVNHALGAMLGAVMMSTGPHLFYTDNTTGDVREMFQQ